MQGRRLQCVAAGQVEVAPFAVGVVGDDEIVVQNAFTAVSVGTEVYNYLHGGEPGRPARFPRPTGYCNAGTVVAVGAAVADVAVGDQVAGEGHHASHSLLAKYHLVPDGTDLQEAAFLVMGAIALHGIRKAAIELGTSTVVLGLGMVGQLALSLAQLSGATPVLGLDLDEGRLQRAQGRGANAVASPEAVDAVEWVRQHSGADGADLVIEATANRTAVYPLAVRLARMGGRLLALGSPRGSVEMDFFSEVHEREVDIVGAHQPKTPRQAHIYYPWSQQRDRGLLLQLMQQGRLPVADLISHRARPEDCQDIYQMLAQRPQEGMGVVFDWGEDAPC